MAGSEVQAIIQLVTSVGNWVLFFWLFMQSQKEVKEVRQAHMDDLRQIASLERTPRRYELPRSYEPPESKAS